MAPPIREITDELDVPTAAADFGDVQAGVPTSPPLIRRVWNNRGGGVAADPITGAAFVGEARLDGSPADFVGEGVAMLDADAIQIRLADASAGVAFAPTDWFPLGGGERFWLPVIPGPPGGEYVEVELRINLPAEVDPQATEIAYRLDEALFGALPASHVANTVPTGRDDSTTSVVIDGAPITPGLNPFELDVPLHTWYHDGRGPWEQVADDAFPVDSTDGAGDPLAPGEAYILLLSRRRATGFVVTKGVKDTTPLTEDDRPAVPAGDAVHAWVTVPEGGGIVTIEEPATAFPGYWTATAAGLVLVIGPGPAFVDGADVQVQTPIDLGALPISSVVDVYVRQEGSLEAVDSADVPTGRPMRIWRAVTDGVEIVDLIDHRPVEGGGFSAA
jgi:hypothetical protein